MRHFIPIILILSAINLNSQVEPTDTDGDGYINISTLDHLRWVSENEIAWDKNYELDNDIDASDTQNWNIVDHDSDTSTAEVPLGFKPIGDSSKSFSGEFLGKNHKIHDLYINRPDENNVGFFRKTKNKISNFTLKDVEIVGDSLVAGLTAENNGELRNCSISGKVTGKNITSGLVGFNTGSLFKCANKAEVNGDYGNIAGLIAINNDGSINQCNNEGSITGRGYRGSKVAGLITKNEGFVSNCYNKGRIKGHNNSAGLISICNNSVIYNCYNYGSIRTDGDVNGGLIAEVRSSNISRCLNRGSIYYRELSSPYQNDSNGGLIGVLWSGSVDNCYNKGYISGLAFHAGLITQVREGIVINCYSVGSIQGIYHNYGLISGVLEGGEVKGCYWIEGDYGLDGNERNGLPKEKMKKRSTYVGWDFETTWTIDETGEINDGYPYFKPLASSVEEEINTSEMNIYPNPTSDFISFELENDIVKDIRVFDIEGKEQLSFDSQINKVNVSSLPHGFYLLVVRTNSETYVKRFVKE